MRAVLLTKASGIECIKFTAVLSDPRGFTQDIGTSKLRWSSNRYPFELGIFYLLPSFIKIHARNRY